MIGPTGHLIDDREEVGTKQLAIAHCCNTVELGPSDQQADHLARELHAREVHQKSMAVL